MPEESLPHKVMLCTPFHAVDFHRYRCKAVNSGFSPIPFTHRPHFSGPQGDRPGWLHRHPQHPLWRRCESESPQQGEVRLPVREVQSPRDANHESEDDYAETEGVRRGWKCLSVVRIRRVPCARDCGRTRRAAGREEQRAVLSRLQQGGGGGRL